LNAGGVPKIIKPIKKIEIKIMENLSFRVVTLFVLPNGTHIDLMIVVKSLADVFLEKISKQAIKLRYYRN
jgi:hypothetical protein